MAKKIVFVVSIALNALFILLLMLLFGLGGGTSSFTLLEYGAGYLNSAFIVSVPLEDADLNFGPVDIALRLGDKAYLQFSALSGGRQSSLAMDPLYDHGVISVDQSAFGLAVRGINPGEAVLQLFSPTGFKDIAHVTVYQ